LDVHGLRELEDCTGKDNKEKGHLQTPSSNMIPEQNPLQVGIT